MSTTQDEIEEHMASLSLMSKDELLAMKGDNDEEDAMIDEILSKGKAVETKGSFSDDDNPVKDRSKAGDDGKTAGDDKGKHTAVEEDEDEDDDGEDDADKGKSAADGKKVDGADAEATAQAEADAVAKASEQEAEVAALPKLDLSHLTARYNEQISEIDAEKAKALQEMMDGTIDAAAYAKAEAEYLNKRDQLKEQLNDSREWFTEVHDFRARALRETGINYITDKDKAAAWDDWVKRLATNPANADKDGVWYLEQAHKKVMTEFDIAPKATKTADSAGKSVADGKKVAEKPSRTPKFEEIPPTLGGLPAAASGDNDDGGEFAGLDNLTGMDFERAIARLTPDQKERYERG